MRLAPILKLLISIISKVISIMAFPFEWQSEAFTYGTNIGSTKKAKKRKNAQPVESNSLSSCNEEAALMASKKLSMFPMDDSCDKSVSALPVDPVNLKSSLKSSQKRRRLTVSFNENSHKLNSFETIEDSKLSVLNTTSLKKKDKKIKKASKKLKQEQHAHSGGNRMEVMGLLTVASNISEDVKSQVHLEESIGGDISAFKPSVATDINRKQLNGMILHKKQIKLPNEGARVSSSKNLVELNPDMIDALTSQNAYTVEPNGNDMKPPGKMEKRKAPSSRVQKQIKKKKKTAVSPSVILETKDSKSRNNLKIKKTSANQIKLVNEVVKSCSDGSNDEWSDCEDEISHVSDDGPEVQEFDEVGEDMLDANFYKDLENLLDDLDFAGLQKRSMAEPETCEEHESSNEVEDCESDASEDASRTDGTESEDGEEMREDKYDREELNKTETPLLKKQDLKNKSLPNVNTSKLSASLALFSQQQLPSSGRSSANKPTTSTDTLVQKMRTKLNVAKFRMINEQLYSSTGSEALQLFKREPESFRVYHDGFKSQVALWPLNPLDVIVDWLKLQPRQLVVADFGCGEAELSERVSQRVHSLDLVATKPQVTVCDMARTPLASQTVDVAVFCLSLMGTNVSDFITEANRTLKLGGILKIAEVESRITNLDEFVATVQKFGFKCNKKPVNHQYFVTMDFKKFKNSKAKDSLPQIKLKPCLYKKR